MKKSIHYYVVRAWFLLDGFIALYPPLYWAAGQPHQFIHGFPVSFLYFMAVCISITGSILYAYWGDKDSGEVASW